MGFFISQNSNNYFTLTNAAFYRKPSGAGTGDHDAKKFELDTGVKAQFSRAVRNTATEVIFARALAARQRTEKVISRASLQIKKHLIKYNIIKCVWRAIP